jgi:hypothetical protein
MNLLRFLSLESEISGISYSCARALQVWAEREASALQSQEIASLEEERYHPD